VSESLFRLPVNVVFATFIGEEHFDMSSEED